MSLSVTFSIMQEKCAQYWPSDGVVVYGDISIEIKREEESESYTVRDLLVTNNRVRKDSMNQADAPNTNTLEGKKYFRLTLCFLKLRLANTDYICYTVFAIILYNETYPNLFFLPSSVFPGEQGSSGASVPFPWLARGGHPHRR